MVHRSRESKPDAARIPLKSNVVRIQEAVTERIFLALGCEEEAGMGSAHLHH